MLQSAIDSLVLVIEGISNFAQHGTEFFEVVDYDSEAT